MLFLKAVCGETAVFAVPMVLAARGGGGHSTLHGVVFAILYLGRRRTAHIVSKTRVSAL
jgi:hypothetical protein